MSAVTDRMALRYAIEDTYGELPSGGSAMQTVLITSENLTTDFQTIEDDSVIGTRRVRDLIRVGEMASGDINFNLIYGNLDDLLQGALADNWAADVLEDQDVMISYALEKHFQDVAEFYAFRGVRVGGLALNFGLQDIIRGTLSVMGRGGVFAGSTIGTGAALDAVVNESMVTLDQLTIEEGAALIEVATEFSFQIQNNLREKRVLGSTDLKDLLLGKARVSGSLTAYFESRAQAQKLIDDDPSDYEIVTQDTESNSYAWIFPRFKFTEIDGPANTGEDQDVMLTLNWTATEDPSTGVTMRVER